MRTSRRRRWRMLPSAARRAQRKAPARLVSRTESKSSSLMRMSRVSRVMPALATSTSTGPPKIPSASVNAASTEAESVTSHVTPCRPSGGSPERCVMTTLSPASAKALAIARPMPRLPPVTSTFRACIVDTVRPPSVRPPPGRCHCPKPNGLPKGRQQPQPPARTGLWWKGAKSQERTGGAHRHLRVDLNDGRPGPAGSSLPHDDGHPRRLLRPRVRHVGLAALDGRGRGRLHPLRRRGAGQRREPPAGRQHPVGHPPRRDPPHRAVTSDHVAPPSTPPDGGADHVCSAK